MPVQIIYITEMRNVLCLLPKDKLLEIHLSAFLPPKNIKATVGENNKKA